MAEKIELFRAIAEMRRISAAGGTFSMKFRKYNRASGRGGDLVTVEHARLRPAAREERVRDAGHKIFFTDCDRGRSLNCWQMLVMELNGRKTYLN